MTPSLDTSDTAPPFPSEAQVDPLSLQQTAAPMALPAQPPPGRIQRFRHWIGLDRAIGFTLLARVWSGLAGLVTLRLIAGHLSLEQQGYYYTFGSLVALQIVFELGFSSVILQLASHEAAHLTVHVGGATGSLVAHQRLASVLQRSVRWYLIASLLMVGCVLPAGITFFTIHRHGSPAVQWFLPWISVVLAAAFTFQIDPIFSFLEGCGFVSQVARARFWQAFTGSILAWSALLLRHGLFAPALLIGGQALAGTIFLFKRRGLLLHLLRLETGENNIRWSEVWPFQWRIAVSWLCGYFISQLFNPILFLYWGPAAAGQMGMSLQVMNALSTIALSWVYTKAAPFGQMIARKQYAALDHLFFRAVSQSVVLCSLGSAILWCFDVWLHARHSPFAVRLLPPLPFGLLLIVPVLNQVVASEALYLRAHKQEKFLINSVLGATCIALSTWFLGRSYGAQGMVWGFFIVSVVIGVGLGTYTFTKYRKLWHNA